MTRLALTTRARRRLLIAGSIVGGVAILMVIGLLVVYPRVGAWMVRSKVVPKLEAKLGRAVSIAGIDVSLGHATLRDIVIRGPNDGTAPMVRIDKVEVEFATLPSLVGTAKVEDVIADGVMVTLRRGEQSDNFTDLIVKLGLRKPADGSAPPKSASFGSMRPEH